MRGSGSSTLTSSPSIDCGIDIVGGCGTSTSTRVSELLDEHTLGSGIDNGGGSADSASTRASELSAELKSSSGMCSSVSTSILGHGSADGAVSAGDACSSASAPISSSAHGAIAGPKRWAATQLSGQ